MERNAEIRDEDSSSVRTQRAACARDMISQFGQLFRKPATAKPSPPCLAGCAEAYAGAVRFNCRSLIVTEAEKRQAYEMIENLEREVTGLVSSLGNSREFSLALTKMEEAAMWLRRAVDLS